MNLHLITTNGRLRSYWDSDDAVMEIRLNDTVEKISEKLSADELIEIIERWNKLNDLNTNEILWIMNQVQSWESHAAYADKLYQYGEIGVSY